MATTIYFSRSVCLPCGAEVEVEYRVTANVTAEENELVKVEHIEGNVAHEWSTELNVDEFSAALSGRDWQRLDALLDKAAAAHHESRAADAAEARADARREG